MSWLAHASRHRFHPERLFRPASVVVLGAESAEGALLLANLRAGGFGGTITAAAIGDIASLPEAPDVALLAAPLAAPHEVLTALAARGCFAAIATALMPGLREAARASGVRVLGPGSFGLAVPALGLNATLGHLPVPPGRTALISQSAALCRAVLDWAGPNGVGFSHIIGIGGNADIGFGLTMDWLARDPGTGAILLDIRRLKDPRAFLSAARAAARLRPVVALGAGGLLRDAEEIAHRAPRAGTEAAFAAAGRRAGLLVVNRFEDLLAAAETLSRAPPIERETLAIATAAIAPGEMAADEALRLGIPLLRLPGEIRAALARALPPELAGQGGAYEPLYLGHDQPARFGAALTRLAASGESGDGAGSTPGSGVGGILALLAPPASAEAAGDIAAWREALLGAAQAIKRPLLIAVLGETTGATWRRHLAEAGLPVFATPEQAVHGFFHLCQHRRNRLAARELPPSTVLRLLPDRAAARRVFAGVRQAGRHALLQDEALAVLSAYGIPVVPTRAASSPEDAVAAAAMLGYPVVLKLRRTEKPGAPSVVLDLTDPAALSRAAARMAARETPAHGFVVQRQIGRAREFALSIADDAVFGPVISFGLGGSAGAIFAERTIDLPPLNLPLAHALIVRSGLTALLGAFREFPPANVEAIAETLVRLSQLAVDFPEIADVRIDPLFVDGDGVLTGDAGLTLRPAGQAARLAILPYPVELEGTWRGGGETLLIRPIRPEDAEAHGAFFQRLSPDDIRFRFFSPMRALSAEQMARMTQVDYQREIAFIAVREASGETVGVARLVRELDDSTGEFAIIIQPDMKGKGVGAALMHRLIAWGRAQGMREIIGQVLADNAPMLAFVRHLGFTLHRLPGEEDVIEARLSLLPVPEPVSATGPAATAPDR
jgi:acetyltransferase